MLSLAGLVLLVGAGVLLAVIIVLALPDPGEDSGPDLEVDDQGRLRWDIW